MLQNMQIISTTVMIIIVQTMHKSQVNKPRQGQHTIWSTFFVTSRPKHLCKELFKNDF